MIDAKSKFREGFILIKQPFKFVEGLVIQMNTIVWAYSEKPITRQELNSAGVEKLETIRHTTPPFFFGSSAKTQEENWFSAEVDKVFEDLKNYDQIYEGEVVQCTIEGVTCRFYPNEYSVLELSRVQEILEEEGYHTVVSNTLKSLEPFKTSVHYLKSRGISKSVAEKWVSTTYKDLVYYKPYYSLLSMFARSWEMYPDKFYEEVEGIKIL